MKIRIRYRNGQLQVVQQEVQDDLFEDADPFDLSYVNWLTSGADPIRSMIRGKYDLSLQRKYLKK